MVARLLSAVFLLSLFACVQPPPSDAPPPAGPQLRVAAPLPELMRGVLEPAAEVLWDSAGFVITAEGETDLSPTSDEGWAAVRDGAVLVAESGNLLMVPGRSQGPAWDAWGRALIETGTRAMAAADAQDADALFSAGGEVYQVCRGCHMQYWVDGDSPHAVELP